MAADDPKGFVDRLVGEAGVPVPKKLPALNARAVSFRFLAATVAATAMSRARWRWRSGGDDGSYDSGVRQDLFDVLRLHELPAAKRP